MIDVLFFMDVIFNFRTTYMNSKTGLLVTNAKKIAINYALNGRLFIDIIASIPLELILSPAIESENSQTLQVLGLVKLVRLLRLGRIITFMKMKQSFKLGLRIFQTLFILILIDHWVACIWFMIVSSQEKWFPPTEHDRIIDNDFYNRTAREQYTNVLYYSVLLMVGNDALPTT